MNNDLQARLNTAERMNRWLIAGTPEAILAERLELQTELRHQALMCEVRQVTIAIRQLIHTIQGSAAITGRKQ